MILRRPSPPETSFFTLRSAPESRHSPSGGGKLYEEGHRFRPSKPKFHRTALSWILRNRFYIGELHRNGKVFQGKYQLIIDRGTFNACQDIMDGRNRRIGKPSLAFSGGIIRCAHCGSAITGECIRRKQGDGSVRSHTYYRCANNDPADDHPKVRWREDDLESAILEHLEAFRLPTPEVADWYRQAIEAAFDNRDHATRQRMRMLKKRRTEIESMQQRLLDGYLAGAIEEAVFTAKSADMKAEQKEIVDQITESPQTLTLDKETALGAFEFSQNLTELWRGSNSAQKREILDCVSLNRTLSDVSLYVERRKPFDIFAKRPSFPFSRGDYQSFEHVYTTINEDFDPFFSGPRHHIYRGAEIVSGTLPALEAEQVANS